jgi:hypothetical protein
VGLLANEEVSKLLRASCFQKARVNVVELTGSPDSWTKDIAAAALDQCADGSYFLFVAKDTPENREGLSGQIGWFGLRKTAERPDLIFATSLHFKPGAFVREDAAFSPEFNAVLNKQLPILKTNEERYVLGIVLEPGVVDAQNDTYTAATIRVAAFKFMEEYGNLGLQHRQYVNGKVKILENWLTKTDEVIEGQLIKAGTWMLGVRVNDDQLWDAVKSGKITGFSIGGFATRLPVS